MAGKITTHILDTASGKPGAGIRVVLIRVESAGLAGVKKLAFTNADGRTDEPLLSGDELKRGLYCLNFSVRDYFKEGFYDEIPVMFRVDDPDAHYHVPLLCSPWSYSTYRGS